MALLHNTMNTFLMIYTNSTSNTFPNIGNIHMHHPNQEHHHGLKKKTVDSEENVNLFDRNCKELKSVYFFKTHKTGSTSICNILCRFGMKRKLNILRGNYTDIPPHSVDIFPFHEPFNESLFSRIMQPDTVYISILREPLSQFISSAVYYYLEIQLFNRKGKRKEERIMNCITDFDTLPESERDILKQDQARVLGFDTSKSVDAPETLGHLHNLKKQLDFVMILEHWHESLVLLRRRMCWTMQDILFRKALPANEPVGVKKPDMTWFNSTHREIHRQFSPLDHLLYDHFLQEFKRLVAAEGQDFQDEVIYFQKLIRRLEIYCSSSDYTEMHIASARWHHSFSLTKEECFIMRWGDWNFQIYRDLHFTFGEITEWYVNRFYW